MRTAPKSHHRQRGLLDKKLTSLAVLADSTVPTSGWIKAIRGALGLTLRQLADRMGSRASSNIKLMENRESVGKITLETLAKAARAMDCRLVYAFVPAQPNRSLEDILDRRAQKLARSVAGEVHHSMALEDQRVPDAEAGEQTERLAADLKACLDPRLWGS